MLTRLMLRLSVWLLPLLTLMSIVLPIVGERQTPAYARWIRLGFGQCALPCWAGITPGETDFLTVPDIIAERFPTDAQQMVAGGSVTLWADIDGQTLSGVITQRNGRVAEVRVITELPLRQLIAELGAPDCVRASAFGAPGIELYWEDETNLLIVQVQMNAQGGWSLNSMAQLVSLNAATIYLCERGRVTPWLGFAPLSRYLAVMNERFGSN